MLAHVSPPDVIFELRTFDVVLLVFVSGISYHMSCGNVKYRIFRQDIYSFVYIHIRDWICLDHYDIFHDGADCSYLEGND